MLAVNKTVLLIVKVLINTNGCEGAPLETFAEFR